MTPMWTGAIAGDMHRHKITSLQLAAEVGWHPKYLSAVLNGRRTPAGAESKLREALNSIVGRQEVDDAEAESI